MYFLKLYYMIYSIAIIQIWHISFSPNRSTVHINRHCSLTLNPAHSVTTTDHFDHFT